MKHVSDEKHDVFLDGVGWEGGDEWIRTQFRVYLLCLLRTSLLPGKLYMFSEKLDFSYTMWKHDVLV